jgi:phosphoribosylglycinamide formyltransferase-1
MPRRLKLAVLISGSGTTLKNLLDCQASGTLDVDFRLVISSKPDVGGLKHAATAGIPSLVVRRGKYPTAEEFCQAVFQPCRDRDVDLVVMGGFLAHVLIPTDFIGRVVNIHPALIPAFCGKGYYGLRVHQAVLDYGAKASGCTVHFVDNQYDHGPIILQRSVAVAETDSAESLAQRVFAVECEAYPAALRLIAADRVSIEGRRVRVADGPA